jgi:hypothetical protein
MFQKGYHDHAWTKVLIPQNLVIYHMCHHIEHLFYLWQKYGAIRTYIASPIESFSIKLHSEIWFLNHFSTYLKTCFNHPNHIKSPQF